MGNQTFLSLFLNVFTAVVTLLLPAQPAFWSIFDPLVLESNVCLSWNEILL